jgi:hypothetical protein
MANRGIFFCNEAMAIACNLLDNMEGFQCILELYVDAKAKDAGVTRLGFDGGLALAVPYTGNFRRLV